MIRAALLALVVLAVPPQASLEYFTHVRDITSSQTDRQNYIVLDGTIWEHARRDLADLRIYQGDKPWPFTLKKQEATTTRMEEEANILNLGSVADGIEFDLKIVNLPEYDRVNLHLSAKNFVTTASVYGTASPGVGPMTQLGSYTIYDLSREGLDSNFLLKLPDSSFHFLHLRLAKFVTPAQLSGATVSNYQEKKAAWTAAGSCQNSGDKNKYTNFACHVPDNFPVARLEFKVSGNENFRRTVAVIDSNGAVVASSGISRIHLKTAGTSLTSEELTIPISDALSRNFVVSVNNGDDPPLPVAALQPYAVEHRVYFEPRGNTALKLYYGDEQLEAPSYDYAKTFQEQVAAAQAQLGAEVANPTFRGRPDQRPWSERHSWILWCVMILIVVILGAIALRGFRTSN